MCFYFYEPNSESYMMHPLRRTLQRLVLCQALLWRTSVRRNGCPIIYLQPGQLFFVFCINNNGYRTII
jgi:hypothetical protein